jgi:arylsulfatase A
MNLARLTLSALFLSSVPHAVAAASAGAAPARKPNLILIMADDFGYEGVTANGGESYRTPNLDRLARQGIRFEQCHVQPLCTPTRVQLMTGLYNVRNYVDFGTLDPKAKTFAHLLKGAGYATGIAGKWQLGEGRNLPQHFGFDEAFLWQHTRRPPRYANPGLEHNGREQDHENGAYGPKLVNDFALDFVTRHRQRPFLLYYPMILPHAPFQPTPDSADWDPRARGETVNRNPMYYADMVAYLDKMVGRLVDKLDELGLRENTLVMFLGDNGTPVGITTQFKGRPYEGGKGTRDARGTHVPLIASWPGRIPAGQVNRDLIGSVDFFPTMAEAAGVPLPKDLPDDGRSFLPQLLGNKGEPREWLYSWYVRDGGPTATFEFAMSTRYKLYRDGTFFDLGSDWFEEHPLRVDQLRGERAAAAKKLQAALDRHTDARPPHLLKPIEMPNRQKAKAAKGKKQ